MNMDAAFGKARLLRALTSLDRAEFARLEAGLEKLLAEERLARRHDGGVRQRAFGAGGETSKLPTARAKLFFVLFYFKAYPLQEVMAWFFGMSQPQVCEWIKRLTPLVGTVLGRELLLPARKAADLEAVLAEHPELMLIIDGTERPIRRPKDQDDQKQDYSGKKKAHRKKNLVISFQGHEPPGTETLQPKKKPRGRELHSIQKTINQVISRVRVGVEHVICGIKRCHIVADTFRNRRRGFVDEVMAVASGLHNLRVATRTMAA